MPNLIDYRAQPRGLTFECASRQKWAYNPAMDSLLPDPTDLQKQKLVSQAEELRKHHARPNVDPGLAARMDSYQTELRGVHLASIAAAGKAEPETAKTQPREEDEKQASRENRNAEPIRDASTRYAQALGMHYNILDPYGSLARAAMAEHAAFRGDRERLDKQIAQATDPGVRQALELRKEIEKADYMAMTSDRIARQSYVITGNKTRGSEFDKFTKQADDNRQHATELRQQWRALTQPEQDRSQTANTLTPRSASDRGNPAPNAYADLKNQPDAPATDQAAEIQKNQEQQVQRQRHRGPRM